MLAVARRCPSWTVRLVHRHRQPSRIISPLAVLEAAAWVAAGATATVRRRAAGAMRRQRVAQLALVVPPMGRPVQQLAAVRIVTAQTRAATQMITSGGWRPRWKMQRGSGACPPFLFLTRLAPLQSGVTASLPLQPRLAYLPMLPLGRLPQAPRPRLLLQFHPHLQVRVQLMATWLPVHSPLHLLLLQPRLRPSAQRSSLAPVTARRLGLPARRRPRRPRRGLQEALNTRLCLLRRPRCCQPHLPATLATAHLPPHHPQRLQAPRRLAPATAALKPALLQRLRYTLELTARRPTRRRAQPLCMLVRRRRHGAAAVRVRLHLRHHLRTLQRTPR